MVCNLHLGFFGQSDVCDSFTKLQNGAYQKCLPYSFPELTKVYISIVRHVYATTGFPAILPLLARSCGISLSYNDL